ncbi:MAG TPA: DNA polymerase III subunit delta [Hyphomonadaceae bacterium]|nr:DNA polymerase III subunit delta [Hyphomonadaceae bacterium]
MKQAGARALAFCESPPARPRIALIFGGDPGLVSTSADALARVWVPAPDPINVIKLTDDDLRRDPQLLADELVARSLLGGDRLVRLHAEKDASYKLILEIIADIDKNALVPEAFWIIEAGELNKTNKLRAGIEAAESAIALQLYADDEASVSDLVTKRLAAAGAAIEPDALVSFVADLPGDRRLALSELEKLELYAVGLGRPITAGDVALLASAEQPRGADDAADAAIAGDAPSATLSVNRYLDAGGSAISALRTLHFRLLRVSDAVASGAGTGVRLRPPIFEREWPAFSRALRDWPAPAIHRAFTRLYEAERACKQAGAPSEAILRQLIHRIAVRSI